MVHRPWEDYSPDDQMEMITALRSARPYTVKTDPIITLEKVGSVGKTVEVVVKPNHRYIIGRDKNDTEMQQQ